MFPRVFLILWIIYCTLSLFASARTKISAKDRNFIPSFIRPFRLDQRTHVSSVVAAVGVSSHYFTLLSSNEAENFACKTDVVPLMKTTQTQLFSDETTTCSATKSLEPTTTGELPKIEPMLHLQYLKRVAKDEQSNSPSPNQNLTAPVNLTKVLEFVLPNGTVFMSLGSNITRFQLFLEYCLNQSVDIAAIKSREIQIKGVEGPTRERLMQLWESGRLLAQKRVLIDELRHQTSFRDLLMLYIQRVKMRIKESTVDVHDELLAFLKQNFFGVSGLRNLCDSPVEDTEFTDCTQKRNADITSLEDCMFHKDRPVEEIYVHLKKFLEWFRRVFPYYYDSCVHCGNTEQNTFLGYIYPSSAELVFKAGRTELYHCQKCSKITRFARFNSMTKVLETRKGRCGEYSVLMLQFLEALGYKVRWVVDWADHVWVEVRLGGRWVHVDPCEAALDEPLLYESWGKKQTYIVAFTSQHVEDVTASYTSDFNTSISRREVNEHELKQIFQAANLELKNKEV